MYVPFISTLLHGLLSLLTTKKLSKFDSEGVVIQLFVFQHILGSTVHQWDASACLVDRHRSSHEKQWRSGRVRPVVPGGTEEVWICFKVFFFPSTK